MTKNISITTGTFYCQQQLRFICFFNIIMVNVDIIIT